MTIQDYQKWTPTTAIYPKERAGEYLTLGLVSEIGEVAGVLKKKIRDGNVPNEDIAKELGDCFWYLSELCNLHHIELTDRAGLSGKSDTSIIFSLLTELDTIDSMFYWEDLVSLSGKLADLAANHGFSVAYILQLNHDKLESRKQRAVLGGSGDER